MIHTVNDFFNKAATDIRERLFPDVKYYRDSEPCTAATYAIELFNNGCINYRQLIGRLSKHCKVKPGKIHAIIEKHIVSFGADAYKPKY